MDVASGVMALSSTAAQSVLLRAKEECSTIFGPIYETSRNYCTLTAIRHPRCFTELARTAILAIGCSMLQTGKRPNAELSSWCGLVQLVLDLSRVKAQP
jgi:hypothetical protein